MDNILELSAVGLSERIKAGDIKVIDVVNAVIEHIENVDDTFNSFIIIDKEYARIRAGEVQALIDAGKLDSKLAGVPFAVKDNICTKGIRTTCGSKILNNFVPTYSALAVTLLENAGAIIIGKTNMDEFAMGSTSETSAYGAVKNPNNIKMVAGGSSGGSASAVAANECFFALGSDTGGSVRQPASHCGVVGMKPTYSTVSRYGLIAFASSLDQIGPLCKNVTDMAAVMEVISVYDEKDSTSVKRDSNYLKHLNKDIKGLKIGVPKEYFQKGLDGEVKACIQNAINKLEDMGAVVEEFELGLMEYTVPAYYTISSAEASSNLARYDGIKYGHRTDKYEDLHDLYKKTRSEGFGEEVKRRIMVGSFVLSEGYYDEYYIKALKIRTLIKERFDKAFEKYDVIIGPVTPTTAPSLDASLISPMKMYLSDIYTVPANLVGIPAMSVPCGQDSKGMPVGLQIMANNFREDKIFSIAFALEQSGGDGNA
ncbi:MAG: Asp-tRNA(Asn)/Glu-tRNA(Gln) amidotransferase subunit GatA [Lachnospiraceae bacterium]|nr:Asp-tRNA(Asn)/Glu-tRNA(Gln) amidotransferase subunit GatA [Lachnospiraceae bacterium]